MGHRFNSPLPHLRRGLSGAYFVNPNETGGRLVPSEVEGSQEPGLSRAKSREVRRKASAPSAVSSTPRTGRRMTYEEGLAQQILQLNQTVAGTNHLATAAGTIPGPAETERNGKGATDGSGSRMPFTYMGIQGTAPAQILLPAVGAVQVVASFTCPRRYNGEIEFVANQYVGAGWTEGSGSIIWQILIDGVPVQGYDAILGSMGSTASPGWLGKGAIQFSENQLIQLRVTNVSIGPAGQILLGLLRGHFEPVDTKRKSAW